MPPPWERRWMELWIFVSPSKGKLPLEAMYMDITQFMATNPRGTYRLIIGTDSQGERRRLGFVTAVVIHQVAKGARYYYCKSFHRKIESLRQRIFYETSLSLDTASKLAERFSENGQHESGCGNYTWIYGPNGSTKELIREM